MRKHFKNQLDSGDPLMYFGVECTKGSPDDDMRGRKRHSGWSIRTMARESIDSILKDYEWVATLMPECIPLFRKIGSSNPHADYDRAMGVV